MIHPSPNPHLSLLSRRRWIGLCAFSAVAGPLLALTPRLARAADPKDKRELLAKNQTIAEFQGVAYQQCRGLTSLCPDKCGGSGDFASFRIVKYVAYEKPGEYGDTKQTEYAFQVIDNMKNLKVPKAISDTVAALKKGDYVILDWNHDYVTKDGSSSPERPIVKLEKVTKEQAEKLAGELPTLPPPPQKKFQAITPYEGGTTPQAR
jgi:hypothetical protein